MRIIPRTAAALVLATSLVGVSAWAQSNMGDPGASSTAHKHHAGATGATARQGAPKLSASDKQFFHNAYSDATADLAIGQLARNNAATEPIKKLGQTMVDNSTKQLDGLRTFAEKNGITAPSGMNTKNQNEVSSLSKLQGAEFDKAFLKHVKTREKTVLGEMTHEAKTSKNADLKSWANAQAANVKSLVDEARNIGVTAPQPQTKPPSPKKK
jgi:putative membrane protein